MIDNEDDSEHRNEEENLYELCNFKQWRHYAVAWFRRLSDPAGRNRKSRQ